MFSSLRKRVVGLGKTPKFIVRIVYPVAIYLIFHFLFINLLHFDANKIQIAFLFVWALIEWQVFFRED